MDEQDFMARYLSEHNRPERGDGDRPHVAESADEDDAVAEPSLPPQPEVSDPAQALGDDPTVVTNVPQEVLASIGQYRAREKTSDTVTPARTNGYPSQSPTPRDPYAPQHNSTPQRRESPRHHTAEPETAQAHQPASHGSRSQNGVAVSRPGTGHETSAPLRVSNWGYGSDGGLSPAWAADSTKHLRADELVKARRVPAEMGWRKTVYTMTGHLVNLGAGPAERLLREQISQIGANIPGNYQVAVVSIKGGVGRSRIVAGIGTVYAQYRNEPVIAIDASTTYGGLGRIIDPRATSSIREFMADTKVKTYPQSRKHTGQNRQGLEVLAGNQQVAHPLALSPDAFTTTLARTQMFYQLSLIDCGAQIEHPVMPAILNAADALVIVGTANFDGAAAAEKTIDWLDARRGHDLLRRSVVVLNDIYNCYDTKFVTAVRHSLEQRVGAVKTLPFDEHVRDGAVLDFDALRRPTQLAYIELAAWLAEGFSTPTKGNVR